MGLVELGVHFLWEARSGGIFSSGQEDGVTPSKSPEHLRKRKAQLFIREVGAPSRLEHASF